jgi:predicted DNA binding CopG/RHH family protein
VKKKSKRHKPTAEQALAFLEDFRKMQAGLDEPTQAISLRVPNNILRAYKALAAAENRAYQTMMIQALRRYLAETGK